MEDEASDVPDLWGKTFLHITGGLDRASNKTRSEELRRQRVV